MQSPIGKKVQSSPEGIAFYVRKFNSQWNSTTETLHELGISSNSTLELRNYHEKPRDDTLTIPGEGTADLHIPIHTTVGQLKYSIACATLTPIDHVRLLKDNYYWDKNDYDDYQCTREDLLRLTVEDISHPKQPLDYPSLHLDPEKVETVLPCDLQVFYSTPEPKLDTNSDSPGSSPNLG